MHKIANATELTSELRRLLDYAQSDLPSRARIARELETLSLRLVTASFKAGDSIVLSKDIYGAAKDGFTKGERVTVRGTYKGSSGDMVVLRSGKGVLLHIPAEDVPGEPAE